MGSCAAPSAKGDDKFITTDYLQQCRICHVEAEYFYPGVWEKYSTDELICNYWKFLGAEDRQILESQLSSEDEIDVEYGDYDSVEEMGAR